MIMTSFHGGTVSHYLNYEAGEGVNATRTYGRLNATLLYLKWNLLFHFKVIFAHADFT